MQIQQNNSINNTTKMEDKINILFICKYNVFRSRVAEAYFNKINKNPNIIAKSAGLIPGDEMNEMRMEAVKSCGIQLNGSSKGLNIDLLRWQNVIVIVANNVPPLIFKRNKECGKKLIVWRIKDTQDREGGDISKITGKIKKKVDKLNKKLERGWIK